MNNRPSKALQMPANDSPTHLPAKLMAIYANILLQFLSARKKTAQLQWIAHFNVFACE